METTHKCSFCSNIADEGDLCSFCWSDTYFVRDMEAVEQWRMDTEDRLPHGRHCKCVNCIN